jgi:hypothetical protein
MKDAECRRRALQLASQLPADAAARRTIVDYLERLLPFLDGREPGRAPMREAAE